MITDDDLHRLAADDRAVCAQVLRANVAEALSATPGGALGRQRRTSRVIDRLRLAAARRAMNDARRDGRRAPDGGRSR